MLATPLASKLHQAAAASLVAIDGRLSLAALVAPILARAGMNLDARQLALANGASVNSWTDLSGNTRHATPVATAPTFDDSTDGKKWVTFEGTRILATPSLEAFPAKRGTLAIVYRPDDVVGTPRRVVGSFSGGSGTTWVLYNDPSAGTYTFLSGAFAGVPTRYQWELAGQVGVHILRRTGDTAWNLRRGTIDAGSLTVADHTSTSNPIRIGQQLVGKIGHVLWWPEALTDVEADILGAWLQAEWTSGSVNVVFEGDSQTFGNGFTPSGRGSESKTWPHKLVSGLDDDRISYRNAATSGARWTELEGRATATDSYRNPYATKNILVVWCGTNEAYLNNAANTLAAMWSYCDARRAAGWKVVVATAMDRFDVSNETWRTAVNTGIRADYAAHADGLIDVAADANLGSAGAYNNATYFQAADKIHITEAGCQIVADLAAPVVSALLPA